MLNLRRELHVGETPLLSNLSWWFVKTILWLNMPNTSEVEVLEEPCLAIWAALGKNISHSIG